MQGNKCTRENIKDTKMDNKNKVNEYPKKTVAKGSSRRRNSNTPNPQKLVNTYMIIVNKHFLA